MVTTLGLTFAPGLGAEGAGQLEMLTGTDPKKKKKKKPNKSLLSPAKGPAKGHPSKTENSTGGWWVGGNTLPQTNTIEKTVAHPGQQREGTTSSDFHIPTKL